MTIKGKVWRWEGPAGWYFVYVNEKLSRQIKDSTKTKKVGFHFVRVKATIGKTSWNTTLFPTKDGPYLLAIKADVRKKEGVEEGDSILAHVSFRIKNSDS
jgi:hypothetical protein